MTEKEKAKAYDEAIERAKKLYDKGITEEIFPELNENERIKKDLIQWIDEFPDIIWRGHHKKDVIAWLEKQGEQKKQVHFPKFTFDDILALQCCMVTAKNVQEDNELYEQLNLIHNKMYDAYRLGKQGETSPILSNSLNTGKNEQKPADKIEPKFKVGDKIVNGFMKYMGAPVTQGTILKITDDKYIFTDGSCMSISNQDSWELASNKKPKFDPKTLKPFDRVLVRVEEFQKWRATFFSHIRGDGYIHKFATSDTSYAFCIPYNDDTKHLVGTTDEAPEYYRYWED